MRKHQTRWHLSNCLFALALLTAAPLAAQVSGLVVDANTQAPVAGALVTLQATDVHTTTDAVGAFTLSVPPGSQKVVVAKKGYFNVGAIINSPAVGVQLQVAKVQIGNNHNYQLTSPQTCSICHPDQYDEWNGSPMAKAGVNTWVYDIYDGSGSAGGMGGFVYLRDSVFAASHPQSECASCHQPEPWVKQPHIALEPLSALSQGAMHGISCETCHKIANVDEQRMNYPGIYPGAVDFNLPDTPLVEHQVMYGVLGDVDFEMPGLMRASFQPQLTAEVCGVCHQDKNDPDGDGNFEEANGVISEPTYHEWLASPYGNPASPDYASCVDCHMPPTDATQACNQLSFHRDPGTIRSHRIEGTTPFYLENAVELNMTTNQLASGMAVTVKVDNQHTGHHVPTGVTVRNMVLLVEAWTVEDGQRLLLAAGPTLHPLAGVGAPEQGYYAGLPGKLYAKLIHDATGAAPTFFTDAAGITFDTRIPAKAVDTTKYIFATPPGTGQIAVRARLIYRRAFRAIVDAKQWTTDGHGNPLEDVAAPYYGHLMEEEFFVAAGPGPVTSYGIGCGGLVADHVNWPGYGLRDFAATLAGAPATQLAVLALGLSDSDWLGVPLPLDLGPLGAPGCTSWVSLDVLAATLTDGGGQASLPMPTVGPYGATYFAQWVVPAANPLGWQGSNGLKVILQH